MENSKIAPYQASLERYVLNASEAMSLNTYRRSITHILKIGLMEINATTAVVCRFDNERYESIVIAETSTTRAGHREQTQSDIGKVYDESEYSTALAWLTGEKHEPLQLERDKLEKDGAEYHEFIDYGIFTAIYLPIIVNSNLWGYIEVWESRYPRSFTDEEIALLQELANYVAKAITNNNPDELL